MQRHRLTRGFGATLLLGLAWTLVASSTSKDDPLPSWKAGATKNAILAFVAKVTNPEGENFVPAEARIAVFDNDGTLWVEKPLYVHLDAVKQRMQRQIQADPELKQREPYRSLVQRDFSYLKELYENTNFSSIVGQLFGVAFGGMTDREYDRWAREFFASYRHPKLGTRIGGLTYQPMVELIRYLELHEFRVYIFTADEGAFLRTVSEELYGIPPERVHGSSVRSEFVIREGEPTFVRSYRVEHFNNWDGKPRLIRSVIGRRPLLAVGNSNGDQHMLQYAAGSGGMSILLCHTDADREFAYDSHTDKVRPLAKSEGWLVVGMKEDWARVFREKSEK